ncbi:MAG: YCF48-related protein [Bacteroidota bacterium]
MLRSVVLLLAFVVFEANAQWKKISSTSFEDLYDISVVGHKTFAVGNNSTVLYSGDTGKSWKKMTLTIPNNLRSVCFIDTSIGFVIGENARIQKTTNGGKTWSQKYVKTAAYGYDIAFYNQYGIAVGKDMLAVSSSDTGETWKVDTTLIKFKKLNSVTITNDGNCWAVGDSGYILTKTILTRHWNITRYPSNVDFNHVSHIGNGTIIITGGMPDSSTVGKYFNIFLISVDTGKTWKQRTLSEMKIINTAYFISKDSGFLAGSSGIIVKCKGGIDDRGQQLSGVAASLNEIEFYNGIGLAVGDGGTVLRTTNYGGYALSLVTNKVPSIGIEIYPMPGNGNISLFATEQLSKVTVCNLAGQVVFESNNIEGKHVISDLVPGVYFVGVMNASGAFETLKVVVQ